MRNEAMAKELAKACALLEETLLAEARFEGIVAAVPGAVTSPLIHAIDRCALASAELIVEGWALDLARGNPEDVGVALFFTLPHGATVAFPARRVPRPDLTRHFPGVLRAELGGFSTAVPRWAAGPTMAEFVVVQQSGRAMWGRTETIRQMI